MKLTFEVERKDKFFPLAFNTVGRGRLQLALPRTWEAVHVRVSVHPDEAIVGCDLSTGAFLLPGENADQSFPLYYRRAEGMLVASFREGRLVYGRIRLTSYGEASIDEATETNVGTEAWANLQIAGKLAQGIAEHVAFVRELEVEKELARVCRSKLPRGTVRLDPAGAALQAASMAG